MAIWRTENTLVLWAPEVSPPTVEAPYGTAVLPIYRFGIHETVQAPDPDVEWEGFFGVGGPTTGRSRSTVIPGRWSLRGAVPDIRAQAGLHAGGLADVLALALGRQSGGVVVEGLTSSDGRIPSFTMQIAAKDTDGHYTFVRDYIGGKVGRATLSANEGQDLRLSLDEILFKDFSIGGELNAFAGTNKATNPSTGTDNGLNPKGRFVFAGATISVFGVTVARVKRFSLSIDNMLEPKYYWAISNGNAGLSQVPTEIVEGRRRYSMDMELDMVDPATDASLFAFYLNQAGGNRGTAGLTGGSIVMTLQSSEGTTGGAMVLTLSPAGGVSNTQPGSIMTGAKINLPPPPTGFHSGSFSFDVDRIQIAVPA